MENGDYIVTEDCKELIRQVQLVKKNKIEVINKHCDALFLRIDLNKSVKVNVNK